MTAAPFWGQNYIPGRILVVCPQKGAAVLQGSREKSVLRGSDVFVGVIFKGSEVVLALFALSYFVECTQPIEIDLFPFRRIEPLLSRRQAQQEIKISQEEACPLHPRAVPVFAQQHWLVQLHDYECSSIPSPMSATYLNNIRSRGSLARVLTRYWF